MSCIKYQRMISRLVDGELPEAAAEELRIHLVGCSRCQTFSQQASALDRGMKTIESALPRSALAGRVKAHIAEQRPDMADRHVFPAWARVPVMAVLVLCALGVGNLAGKSLSTMFVADRQVGTLDLLETDGGQSFTDALLEIAGEGTTQ
ncbi:MAG: zf-HC2 domain-containing protein [Pseudomonadota bacterium]